MTIHGFGAAGKQGNNRGPKEKSRPSPGGEAGSRLLAEDLVYALARQGYRVVYRETHVLLDDLAEAVVDATRKEFMESLTTVPLLIIDDFGMRKLPLTAAEDLLEIVMRRYERASTLLTKTADFA